MKMSFLQTHYQNFTIKNISLAPAPNLIEYWLQI